MMQNKGLLPNADGFHPAGHINGTDVTMADVASATETIASLADRGIGPMQWVPKGAGASAPGRLPYPDLLVRSGAPSYGQDGLTGGGLVANPGSKATSYTLDLMFRVLPDMASNSIFVAITSGGSAQNIGFWYGDDAPAAGALRYYNDNDETEQPVWFGSFNDGAWHSFRLVVSDGAGDIFVDGRRLTTRSLPNVTITPEALTIGCMTGGDFIAPAGQQYLKNVAITEKAAPLVDYDPATAPTQPADGMSAFYPLVNGVTANQVHHVPPQPSGWVEIVIPAGSKGVRFYLQGNEAMDFTIQASGTVVVDSAAFFSISASAGTNWDESLSGVSLYVRNVVGSPRYRVY